MPPQAAITKKLPELEQQDKAFFALDIRRCTQPDDRHPATCPKSD